MLGTKHAEQCSCITCTEALEEVIEVVDRQQPFPVAELGDELKCVAELLGSGP